MAELDRFRFTAKEQDRWGVFRECLVSYEVEVPDGLPVEPEQINIERFD